MKKLVGNFFLVFTIFCTATVSASSLRGKAIYCEHDKGSIEIHGYTFGSALGVHFRSSSKLSVFDNTDRDHLLDAEYEPLNDTVTWKKEYAKTWFYLHRQSLTLEISPYWLPNIFKYENPVRTNGRYSCEVVSRRAMKDKLEESRKREMAGNKL